jgi:peptidoglycan hydrolase-like protein with peptidoglycan-binding domain
MTTQDISNVQRMLNSLGDHLDNDGHLGPQTKEAIKQFQLKYSMLPTGLVDTELVDKLTEVFNDSLNPATTEGYQSFFQKYQNEVIVGSVIFFIGGLWFVKTKLLGKTTKTA